MSGKGARPGKAAKGITIIRREEVAGEGHHGGAWKVAYADFVTAMMAFFLLMWLLNATTEEQRRGLADYFSPISATTRATSGTGQPFGGKTPYESGDMVSDRGVQSPRPGVALAPTAPEEDENDGSPQPNGSAAPTRVGAAATGKAQMAGPQQGERTPGGGPALRPAAEPRPQPSDQAALRAVHAGQQAEQDAFARAADQIREAVRADPALAALAPQLRIDQTPEGLRVQLLDAERVPMFATGSAALQDRARDLLLKIAPVLAKLPEPVSVSGHTDAAPYRGTEKTNWELSAERANATRRLLVEAGLPEARFRSVTGNADRDPLVPNDPLAPANRRIAIVVLRTPRAAAP